MARPSSPLAASNRQWKLATSIAAAAAVVVLVPAGMALLRGGGLFASSIQAVMLMTNIGEIREVTLQDGSKVTLDTSTKLEVKIGRSRRSARLRYGRARFQIASGSVPFVVETDETTVTAAQGLIEVERMPDRGVVGVIAGAADVRGTESGQPAGIKLEAGESVSVSRAGAVGELQSRAPTDWTRGMLQFDGTLLADAVALANRYSGRKIIVAGDVGALKITGAFRAGDTEGLAKALAAAFDLSVVRRPDGAIGLSRKSVSPENKKGG